MVADFHISSAAALGWLVPSGLGFGVQLRDLALRLRFDPGRLWSRLGGPECPMHRQQFLQHAAQLRRLQRIRSVRFGFLGIVVDFHEHAIHARRYRCARQQRNKLRLAAAVAAPSSSPEADGNCTE